MEYNQNYENDLNILTKQLNKISLEKSYEKLIEPYKNNPALVKMLHKKNEHLFEEYKDNPDLEDKNILRSLNENQISNLIKVLKVIENPNEIKNVVNPDDNYFYRNLIETNPLKPLSIENDISSFMSSINNGEERLKIKQIILEIAEKNYPEIIKNIYPDAKDERVNDYFHKNHIKLLHRENVLSEEINVISKNPTELYDFLNDDKKPPLGDRIKSLKGFLKEKNIIGEDVQNKNKLK